MTPGDGARAGPPPTLAAHGRRARWRRRLGDALLLPLALLLVVLEDVLWRLARRGLRDVSELAPVRALRARLGRLGGWAALPLFLIPEAGGRVGELWVGVLIYQRRYASAALAYLAVRGVATLMAVFIWQSCAPALLRLPWFARVVGWVAAARDWALARTAAWRARLRLALAGGRGGVARRVGRLRLWLARRLGAR